MSYGSEALLRNMRNERIDRKTSKAVSSLCLNKQVMVDDETLNAMKILLNDIDKRCIESRLGVGLTRLIMR